MTGNATYQALRGAALIRGVRCGIGAPWQSADVFVHSRPQSIFALASYAETGCVDGRVPHSVAMTLSRQDSPISARAPRRALRSCAKRLRVFFLCRNGDPIFSPSPAWMRFTSFVGTTVRNVPRYNVDRAGTSSSVFPIDNRSSDNGLTPEVTPKPDK